MKKNLFPLILVASTIVSCSSKADDSNNQPTAGSQVTVTNENEVNQNAEVKTEVASTNNETPVVEKQEEAPQGPSAEEQRRQAEEKIKAQQMKEVGDKKLGLQSTILGGSEADESVLMKKKLLGE